MSGYMRAWSRRDLGYSAFDRAWRERRGRITTPLVHAIADPPPRHSRTGSTYTALCGAQVAVVDATRFPAHGDRCCRKCAKAARP